MRGAGERADLTGRLPGLAQAGVEQIPEHAPAGEVQVGHLAVTIRRNRLDLAACSATLDARREGTTFALTGD